MTIGIMLGVAVVVAVDLANASAGKAFELSAEAVAGKATHQILGGPLGIGEKLYSRLRRIGLDVPMAPVISEFVSSPELGGQTFQLMGIDPFAEMPFQRYFTQGMGDIGGSPSSIAGQASIDMTQFLTQPGAILISQDLAERYKLTLGEEITILSAGRLKDAFISGILEPSDNLGRQALNGLILGDISTVQELSGRVGRLDHIDLILPAGQTGTALSDRIISELPDGSQLETIGIRSGSIQQMTSAFRVNLTALSLLALLVGIFLIYNSVTYSVVQRRQIFGIFRCLGVTRGEVFTLVLSEALIVGVFGALSGALLGIILGQAVVRLVTQTINDLFFVLNVSGTQVQVSSLIKGITLGVGATLLATIPPAWEAASIPPRLVLSRSGLEMKTRQAISRAALVGLMLILTGVSILVIPTKSLLISFAGTFAVIVGFALLVPKFTDFFMRLVALPLGRTIGTLGRLAPRNVLGSLSRTSIAVMALMVAVSVTIGVSVMISSFRGTVITWLAETLLGDIYISSPGPTATTPSTPIDSSIVTILRSWPGVNRVDTLRSVSVDSPLGFVQVSATDNFSIGEERRFLSIEIPSPEIWRRMQKNGVLVSEPFANRLGIPHHGGKINLYTDRGMKEFDVLGVYYDYSSTQGTILMALPLYRELWNDPEITAVALRLDPGIDVDMVVRDLQDRFSSGQQLIIRANQSLRQEVLKVFDRTFTITSALQILSTIVAFIGVLSALLSLELERQRELGILRAIGMTIRQVWGMVLLETGLMGSVAGLLSMPAGYILAVILIYIINRRSFGWTLQMQFQMLPFIQALILAVIAALLAGIYPAFRIGQMIISDALRSE
jgi:putative ABC transport system permease protein